MASTRTVMAIRALHTPSTAIAAGISHRLAPSFISLGSSSAHPSSSSSPSSSYSSHSSHSNTSTPRHPSPSPSLSSSYPRSVPSHSHSSHSRSIHRSSSVSAHFSFDTSSFVNRLEGEGLSRRQSVGVMEALEEVVEESIRTMTANLVTRAEQEKHQYTQKVDFAKLKSEITLLEKQDFALLKAENERLLSEVERLKQRLREEITRTQAGVRLDLNLEKGRIRDELSAREVKIKEVDTRIESEISTIRAQMESVKFGILQYVVGSTTGLFALLLAYLRFLS